MRKPKPITHASLEMVFEATMSPAVPHLREAILNYFLDPSLNFMFCDMHPMKKSTSGKSVFRIYASENPEYMEYQLKASGICLDVHLLDCRNNFIYNNNP